MDLNYVTGPRLGKEFLVFVTFSTKEEGKPLETRLRGGGEEKGGKCLFEERRLIERGAYSVFFFNVIVTLYG